MVPRRVATEPVPHGRGLDLSRDAGILDAALQLVSEVGYDRVTMDAIAARAKSSKATMYRRWDSKASLVVEALKARHQDSSAMPDTGDVRSDLLQGLTNMCVSMQSDELSLMTGLLTASRSDAELARLLREQMMESKSEGARAWTERAVRRGQLPATADLELLFDVAPAMVLMRMVMTGEPVDEAFIVRIVDSVLLPILGGSTVRTGQPHDTPQTTPDKEKIS